MVSNCSKKTGLDSQSESIILESWEEIFAKGEQITKYPHTDLVSLFFSWKKCLPEKAKVLEIGCGPGANISLFLDSKYEYFAVEGSLTAVNISRSIFPQVTIENMNFTKELPFSENSMDLVVDRSSITHNKEHIKSIFEEINRVLKPNGLFIGVDYFSKEHFLYKNILKNESIERYRYALFSDEKEMLLLLKDFKILYLKHKEVHNVIPDGENMGFYDFVIQKKG